MAAYDEVDLHNALYDWNQIIEAVKDLCPIITKRKLLAEHLAAYAISDAILQRGNFQKHKTLLLQFLKEAKFSIPLAAFEHLTEPLFKDECLVSKERFGTFWTEILSVLPLDTTDDDPEAIPALTSGLDGLFGYFGDEIESGPYSDIIDSYRDNTVVDYQREHP